MARDALRSNNDKVERAERILQLAELGRKLETEREKVLLSAVCCLLSAVCCLLAAFCCLLSAVCFLLSAVCCLLSAFCTLLFAV